MFKASAPGISLGAWRRSALQRAHESGLLPAEAVSHRGVELRVGWRTKSQATKRQRAKRW
jgi:hypothetical protein